LEIFIFLSVPGTNVVTDPRLLEQTLKLIGAFSFCGKSKKDDPAVFWLWNFLKIFFWYKEINFIAQK